MMRRIILINGFIALLLVLCSYAQDTVAERMKRVEQELAPAVQIKDKASWTIQERMKYYQVQGISIAVINNFEIEWAKGYGIHNTKSGDPVAETTLFQVASITKPVTAAVALMLVDRGKLELNRDVNEYLKSWKVPENEFTQNEKVTVERLLSHSAGLTVSGFRGYAEGEQVPTILQVLDGKPPANNAPIRVDKKPGSGFRYSGGGYTVLQLLLEDVTGQPLSELMNEMIFKPAGMNNSTISLPQSGPLADQASLAFMEDGTAQKGYRFLPGGSGCCELWTTPTDLARFAIAIQKALRGDTNTVFSATMAKAMVTPHNSDNRGLGFFLRRFGAALYFSHDGGNPGFSSTLIAHADKGYGVVVTSNTNGSFGLITEIIMSAAKVYNWEGLQPEYYKYVEDLIKQFHQIKKEKPDEPKIAERSINQLGYQMLTSGKKKDAIQIFKMNVEFYPQSANCYDSLAEAYETSGNIKAALENYRKAIAMLDKFNEINKSFESNRETRIDKIRNLEKKLH